MCNCQKNIQPAPSAFSQTTGSFYTGDCSVTREHLLSIENKLECVQNQNLFINISQLEVYQFLGQVKTMLNTYNYCEYEVSGLNARLSYVNC